MNAIIKALTDLHYKIPAPILESTFINNRGLEQIKATFPISLDHRIREEVIEARVLEDCNLVGGTEVVVPLYNVHAEFLPYFRMVWRIPFDLTENKRITKVYSLIFRRPGVNHHIDFFSYGGSVYTDAASGLMASHMPIPDISHADIKLIGENTVMIDRYISHSQNLALRCMVENDEELNNLPPASIPVFSRLVELAVKSYIYNTLIIQIDQTELSGGHALGRFGSIVEGYADAEELYQEFFKDRWRKVAIFADDRANKRRLKMIVGGRF